MTPTNGTPANGSPATATMETQVPKPRAEWLARRKAENQDGNFSQMHYARQGVITEEMVYVAQREKLTRGAGARRSRPRPHDHPRQHQPPGTGADVHRRGLDVQDQRQYRQFGSHLEYRRRTEEAALPRSTTAPTR